MMTIYGRAITDEDMATIADYMDDEIREEIHEAFAPCTPDTFIREYLKKDPDFEDLLESEFDFQNGLQDISESAAALFEGGWRAEDKDQLISEYQLTEEEAEQICNELKEME